MRRLWGMALILICAVTFSAHGYIIVKRPRLDALFDAQELELILVAKITSITNPSPSDFQGPMTFSISVQEVVYGNAALKGRELRRQESFEWPVNLLPLEKDRVCIFLFDKHGLANVIPLHNAEVGRAETPAEAKPLMLKELLDELKAEKMALRQRLLLLMAYPIMSAKDAAVLEPYLDSKDEWLRRAALVALMELTHDEKYIAMAADDIRNYLRTHRENQRFADYQSWEKGSDYHPYYAFFEYYPMLHFHYRAEDVKTKAVPLLPLFRVVAAELKDDRQERIEHGLGALYHFGTVEDLPVIYADHDNDDAHIRANALAACARILRLNLRYTNDEDFRQHESDWQEGVKAAIQALKKAP